MMTRTGAIACIAVAACSTGIGGLAIVLASHRVSAAVVAAACLGAYALITVACLAGLAWAIRGTRKGPDR